jgi:hypothetical protein
VKYSYDNTQTNISLNTADYKTTFKNIILPLVLTRSENCKRCCYASILPEDIFSTNALVAVKERQFISIVTESYAPTVERSKLIYGLQKFKNGYFQLRIDI